MVLQKLHSANLRKGRVSLVGQLYVITAVCKDRRLFFSDFIISRTLIQILREHEQRGYAKTLCFVVMPDHFHWMMELGTTRDLSSVVRGVKALTSRRVGKALWQKGFYDRGLRRDADIKGAARYLVANPLRAGLVENIFDYPHWDAVWF